MRSVLSLFVLDNACLVCSAVFSSRGHCARHFLRGWRARRCARQGTVQLWQYRPPDCPDLQRSTITSSPPWTSGGRRR
eukprot:3095458-Pyramimonas_sp.AAC.1